MKGEGREMLSLREILKDSAGVEGDMAWLGKDGAGGIYFRQEGELLMIYRSIVPSFHAYDTFCVCVRERVLLLLL